MFHLTGLFIILAAVTSVRPLAGRPEEGDIPRFGILADGLYRGGQPTRNGFQFLKEKGIKTIINLRGEDNSEEALVEELGMKYVRVPVDEVGPWSQVPQSAIATYFELINDPQNYPIFFHCRRGAERTGVFAALYRMALQHWDAKKAYQEARDIGMRWFYSGLKSQIYDFKPLPRTELQPAMKKR